MPHGRAPAPHYARHMAKAHEDGGGEEAREGTEAGKSRLKRLSRLAFDRPVTTLALAAGVGALMGAELLAAGLAGGAAILLLQRSNLRQRARRVVDEAKERIREGAEKIEGGQEPRHA